MGGERVRSIDEAEAHVRSLTARVDQLEKVVSDHSQRLDTAQTHAWKRAWFWLCGWPMTDWNADHPTWRLWRRRI